MTRRDFQRNFIQVIKGEIVSGNSCRTKGVVKRSRKSCVRQPSFVRACSRCVPGFQISTFLSMLSLSLSLLLLLIWVSSLGHLFHQALYTSPTSRLDLQRFEPDIGKFTGKIVLYEVRYLVEGRFAQTIQV